MSGTGTLPGPGSDDVLRVLGIAGSLRKGSFNRALLRAARELAPDEMRIEIFDGLAEIPPYNADEDTEPGPAPVRALRDAIAGADGVLFATPEYNYGVSGVLKNAYDWASRPAKSSVLIGRPAAIIGAAAGMAGTARAQLQLRQAMVFTQTPVLPGPEVLVARAAERFDDALNLTHEPTREFLAQFLERFEVWIRRLRLDSSPRPHPATRPRTRPRRSRRPA